MYQELNKSIQLERYHHHHHHRYRFSRTLLRRLLPESKRHLVRYVLRKKVIQDGVCFKLCGVLLSIFIDHSVSESA